MKNILLSLLSLNLLSSWLPSCSQATLRDDPTIFVSLMVRNKAHTLPYFLKLFEDLDYPKNRMVLWIKSDQNDDDSIDILNKWIPTVWNSYHNIFFDAKNHSSDGVIETKWTPERFRHIIDLKQEAFDKAKDSWADYVWFLDCDVLLSNNQTLKYMVNTSYPVVSPMLESLSMYSNYWCGMGVDYYYRRTEEYKPIRDREKKGCFKVILVHSCFLIDLRQSEANKLAFKPEYINGYGGPHDDIITFAISGHWTDVPMYVCNQERFGYIPTPLEDTQTIEDDYEQLNNLRMEASVFFPPMVPHPELISHVKYPPKDKLGFDEVFLINLERRSERLSRMEWAFNEIGIDHKLLAATDGKTLNDSYIESLGIRMLPNFADPYHKRPMTMGEIGCFLSHYRIWKEIVDRDLQVSLIFEDDIRFEPNFRTKLGSLMNEVKEIKIDWDLIYLGRKRLRLENETWVEGTQQLSTVEYSYWTLSYVLTKAGAEKLLAGDPFSRLVPVDEYLPIMFDKHPESRWKETFTNRNLKAYSVAPLLVFPIRYVGEEGYISDTEASAIVPEKVRTVQEEPQDKGAKEIAIEELKPTTASPEQQLATESPASLGEFAEVKHSEL